MGTGSDKFDVVEASIDDLHAAIRAGETTLVAVVQQYIDRARAYNGVSSMLVTEDGKSVPASTGVVRAGAPLKFPTETIPVSDVLPDLDKYKGPPLEYGRMEATASKPEVIHPALKAFVSTMRQHEERETELIADAFYQELGGGD